MSKIYGYARISTLKQHIERQIDNIREVNPDAIIITEEYTGTTTDRPNWNKLQKKLKKGDTVIFDEVSRMSRNAAEGVELYEELYNRGVNLVFIKEPHINTETYKRALAQNIALTGTNADYILEGVNRFLMALAKEQIEIAFKNAQAEVDFMRQRTREGVRKARERWEREEALGLPHEKDKPGRMKDAKVETKKSKAVKEIIRKHNKDFGGSLNDIETMKLAECARNTYYKCKAALKEE